jgi:ribosome assembly protein YihI (activator of Der GTPase)
MTVRQFKKESKSAKSRTKKGLPSGSRNKPKASLPIINQSKTNKDPRIGSKKPVPLIEQTPDKPRTEKRYFSPRQELKALEQDTRLNKLLDKLDQQHSLSEDQQQYLDHKLARHRQLCKLLGIHQSPELNQGELDGDELFAQLDNTDISRYE